VLAGFGGVAALVAERHWLSDTILFDSLSISNVVARGLTSGQRVVPVGGGRRESIILTQCRRAGQNDL
jgi:hypothetical protein